LTGNAHFQRQTRRHLGPVARTAGPLGPRFWHIDLSFLLAHTKPPPEACPSAPIRYRIGESHLPSHRPESLPGVFTDGGDVSVMAGMDLYKDGILEKKIKKNIKRERKK